MKKQNMGAGWVGVGFLYASAVLVGCGAAPSDVDVDADADVGKVAAPIQGGQLEPGFPGVGKITGAGLCSSSLIAPSLVLSAKHCYNYSNTFRTVNASGQTTNLRNVNARIKHPGTDMMLLHLDAPINDITPLPYSGAAPAAGSSCTAVGFGNHTENGTTTNGVKRSATVTVTSSTSPWIWTNRDTGSTAKGDSGGPLVCSGTIRGVDSAGDHMTWTRWARASTWIDDNLQLSVPPKHNSIYIAQVGGGVYAADRRSGNYVGLSAVDPAGVTAIAATGKSVFLIRDGQLHEVDIDSGAENPRGPVTFPNATDMVESGSLFVLEGAGIWKITNTDTAAYSRVGTKNWTGATSMATANGNLYVIHASTLYEVNPSTGAATARGGANWPGPTRMTSMSGSLYVIQDNFLWRVANLTTGTPILVDETDWSDSTAITAMGSRVYIVQGGYLYKKNPADLSLQVLGTPDWGGQVVMAPPRCGHYCSDVCAQECAGLTGMAGVMCVDDCGTDCTARECS